MAACRVCSAGLGLSEVLQDCHPPFLFPLQGPSPASGVSDSDPTGPSGCVNVISHFKRSSCLPTPAPALTFSTPIPNLLHRCLGQSSAPPPDLLHQQVQEVTPHRALSPPVCPPWAATSHLTRLPAFSRSLHTPFLKPEIFEGDHRPVNQIMCSKWLPTTRRTK